MIVTNYKKSLRGSGEAGKTTQQITHSSKVSHAQGKCYHGYYRSDPGQNDEWVQLIAQFDVILVMSG